ncbi:MAG: response regulator [Chloroflexi bacterium]|uniref:Response regulator n=1 Tax=Candidatus Chlorohelix allophototropha TaxID=3003348 RepID=A0A8T7LSP5_9CHLR|nr:response regulator [Chloroflexota bacterium]WJW66925.1 response regulator [Chloroflexota bacterium L227-S17]
MNLQMLPLKDTYKLKALSSTPKKILIIDDNFVQASKTKFILEGKGYEIALVRDGIEGIKKADEIRPDLIVLDLYLPKVNGFEVCKTLKSTNKLRNIPIIVFSSENKLKNMVTAYEMGADYYVVKGEEGEHVLVLLLETVFSRMDRSSLRPF